MGLLDFLTPEAGQDRRRWLDSQEAALAEALRYYLGPTGIPDRLGAANEMLNPVVGMQQAAQSGRRAMDPNLSGMDRAMAGMDAATAGIGSVLGAQGLRAGVKAAAPAMERGLMDFVGDESGAMNLGGMYEALAGKTAVNPRAVIGGNGGPTSLLDSIDMPAGTKPQYLGAAPDRSGGDFPRYTPKKLPVRMERLLAQIDDPNSKVQGIFDQYVNKGRTLKGDDWYNTEELRDWFVEALGEEAGDARWREYINMIGATSAGAPVQTNMRIASFYNALSPEDRMRVAEGVNRGDGTPAAVARQLGIDIPNMPPATGPGSYNYGFPYQRLQASNVMNQVAGKWERAVPEGLKGAELTRWLQKNPKVKGFTNDLLGNRRNIAADKHFMRILAMADGGTDFLTQQASYSDALYDTLRNMVGPKVDDYVKTRQSKGKTIREINIAKAASDGLITDTAPLQQFPTAWVDIPNDPEYAALEEMVNRVAKGYDMTPAQFQANLWMGAGDVTGLADESQGTFMDLFRRVLDNRAGERKLTRREMFKDFAENRAPLAVTAGAPLGLLGMGPNEEQY